MSEQDRVLPKARIVVVDQSKEILHLTNKLLNKHRDLEVASLLKSITDLSAMIENDDSIKIILLDTSCFSKEGPDNFGKLVLKCVNTKIIMLSNSEDQKNASDTIRAIAYGAVDFIEKPIDLNNETEIELYEQTTLMKVRNTLELLQKKINPEEFKLSLIKTPKKDPLLEFNKAREKLNNTTKNIETQEKKFIIDNSDFEKSKEQFNKLKNIDFNTPIILRTTKINTPKAIAIASSTGGPQALCRVLQDLKGERLTQPIFITQHIPKHFSSSLATQLTSVSGRKCYEAEEGMEVKNGCIYLAPGDFHMRIEKRAAKELIIKLDQNPPINFCRPSADPMFKSLADIYKEGLLAIVLTGMGMDGLEGSRYIVDNGGVVIAQDKLTSVVWGMPGAVAVQGLCHAVLPIEQIPAYIEMIGAP